MNRLLGITQFVSAAGLAGCSPILYEGRYDYKDGWRKGAVVELGTAESIPHVPRVDCRNETNLLLRVQYAYVKSRHTTDFLNSRVVPVPDDIQLSLRDQVLVNMQKCSALAPTQ